MEFKEPIVVYTAETNLDAHLIVEMLLSNGISAHAVEDLSGVSLWAFGTINQFHQPNVWVDKSTVEKAAPLVLQFEESRRERETPDVGIGELLVECEDCGKTSIFSDTLDGTTQHCPHCHGYVDVGEVPWGEDWGEPDE